MTDKVFTLIAGFEILLLGAFQLLLKDPADVRIAAAAFLPFMLAMIVIWRVFRLP